ncbi:hypothetical protein [uncultured Piscinibacter sp.]|uniref:hypothetical protein n=1 Tax=uncultured Piscinibacter sp. TaxID=1131835 RepID=UPI002626BD83|nr:hypothetical protein [uncultured Piscinibacter sp.]
MSGLRQHVRIAAFLVAMLAAGACRAADLSATEQRWLKGVWPVVAYARTSGLALDIVVQPQPTPGAAPLELGFVDGRCKLVFSMRDNPEAQATLDRIEPGLLAATLELMAAHELGHCRRYLDGKWHGLPAGFVASVPAAIGAELKPAYVQMQSTRREEGYGDLVGLAWTQRQHPQHYARLHAWRVAERSRDLIPGSHHDTLARVRLAGAGVAPGDVSIFTAADALWEAGLAAGE